MFNVIILSSGQSTRLKPITNNIPKVLVNVGTDTALLQQANFWNQFPNLDKIYVVVHPRYVHLLEEYITMNDLNNIEIVAEPESNGSFEAIRNVVRFNPELEKNVFLNWGDLIPLSIHKLDMDFLSYQKNIIFTKDGNCRYAVKGIGKASMEERIQYVETGGNIPGIYYMKEMPDFLDYEIGDDLIEHMNNWQSAPVDLIDFGDMTKLALAHSKEIVSRDFNSIEIEGDVVTKTAINGKGQDLQKKELRWYSKNPPNTPKILGSADDHFKMERAQGQPLYQCYQEGIEVDVLKALEELHETNSQAVTQKIVKRDLQVEVVDKTYDRKKSIQGLLDGFGIVESVNKKPLIDFDYMCTILYDRLTWFNKKRSKYVFIHGDPNFSNTLYDGEKITFIDPRGYFGKTRLYGPETYDQAKVLYALSGYDSFNAQVNFGHYELNDGDLTLQIPPLQRISNLDPKNNNLFNEETYTWLALIWVNLGGYFKNNPLKAVLAYYYGLHLASWLIEDRFPKKRNGYNELYSPLDLVIHTRVPFKWHLYDDENKKDYRGQGPFADKMWKKL
jgi:hypothetical protein